MKLQNLAIIFLVVTIPLIMILSYYLHLQQQTLKLQAEYDTKLAEATKEGIKAFETNTVDWAEWVSETTSKKARDNAQAAINTFITSLANNLHLSGTAKEYMLNYIPAVAMTVYDGYYIYAPTYVPVTVENNDGVQLFYNRAENKVTDSDEGEILYEAKANGETYIYTYENDASEIEQETLYNVTTDVTNAKMEYKTILNNKISYSARYKGTSNTNVMVNYTLDNRIYVYGKVNGEDINKDGYLVALESYSLPRIHLNTTNPKNDSNIVVDKKIAGMECDNTEIESEVLSEKIVYFESGNYVQGTFKYVYDITHEKLYYDSIADNFFTIEPSTKKRQFIDNSTDINIGSESCRYKSLSVLWGDTDNTTEYKKIYQAINGKDKGKWCISIKPENAQTSTSKETIDTILTSEKLKELGLNNTRFTAIYKDFSAISYYVEAYAFTNWVNQNLGNKNLQQLVTKYNGVGGSYETVTETFENNGFRNIFTIDTNNDPEDVNSDFVQHKREVIKNIITSNLNLAISNYNGKGEYIYRLPILTEDDWQQVFSNISLITFFQGVPIGLKTYNNYAIATSTTNREFVDPGELLFAGEDKNYHRVYCEKCGNIVYTGYRSVEYVQKHFEKR